jgi:hypothetical protein
MSSMYEQLQLIVTKKLAKFQELTNNPPQIEESPISKLKKNGYGLLPCQVQLEIAPSIQETSREALSNDIKAIRRAIYQIQSTSGQVHAYKTPWGPVIGVADVLTIIGFNFHPLTPVLLKQTPWGRGYRKRSLYSHSRDQFDDLWTAANLQDRIGLVDQRGICQYTYDTTAFGQSVAMGNKRIPFEVDWQISNSDSLKDEWMIASSESQPPAPCPPCPKVAPLSGTPLSNSNHSTVGIPASQKSDQKK